MRRRCQSQPRTPPPAPWPRSESGATFSSLHHNNEGAAPESDAPFLKVFSPLRLLEVFKVGRLLALAHRHQQTVAGDDIIFVAYADVAIVLRADVFGPDRPRISIAPIAARDGPGPGQRVVDRRDLVVQDVRVGLVRIEALPDDRLAILVERDSAAVIAVRYLDRARFDGERIVAAVAVGIFPFADRIARVGRLQFLRPFAAVG